jgi:hypothetical protein
MFNVYPSFICNVACGSFYPIEQGYITDERRVHIEQGSDDGPICSM